MKLLSVVLSLLVLVACGGGGSNGAFDGGKGAYNGRLDVPVYNLLSGQSLTLRMDGNSSSIQQTVTSSGTVSWGLPPLFQDLWYYVRINAQPEGQRCTVIFDWFHFLADGSLYSGGSWVECESLVRGTVTGLVSGQTLELANGADTLIVNANGTFIMPTAVATIGGTYAVTLKSQPTAQTCQVSNGSGTAAGLIDSISVTCGPIVTVGVGGSVSGLASGRQVTLQNNGADPITLTNNGTYQFANKVVYGTGFNVTVATQPSGQTCSVANHVGSGVVADVSNVNVVCSDVGFSIAGTLNGLASGRQITLRNNGSDDLVLSSNTSFAFATQIPYNGSYAVTVAAQPVGQTCSVANNTGSGVTATVPTIAVTCATAVYSVGGSVSGLATGLQLTLRNSGADPLTLSANGAYTFAMPVPYNGSYAVTVGTQPQLGQTCSVTGGTGSGVTANVSNANVVCSTNTYTVGGTVSGLAGGQQVTLRNNNADPVNVTANGSFTFTTAVSFGGSYSVTVGTQPTGQTCSVANLSGGGVSANISNVAVTCATSTYTIGGTLDGLSGGQLTLRNSAGDPINLSANGSFSFPAAVPYGGSYAVTVATQPVGQTCTVSSGAGSSLVANVADVRVSCASLGYIISGNIYGLGSGQLATLQNNGGDSTTINFPSTTFSFAVPVFAGQPYAVTVLSNTNGLVCTPSSASGTANGNVSTVLVNCQPAYVNISGVVTGLATGQIAWLMNNLGTPFAVNGGGTQTDSFNFDIPSGGDFSITVYGVDTFPQGIYCTVDGHPTGTGVTSNVSDVLVNCIAG